MYIFQASVQNESVMWGDRKLNVAPAIKRSSSNNSLVNIYNSIVCIILEFIL